MIDGFGRHEMEKVDFEPFTTIHTEFECDRRGCDATLVRRQLFAMKDVMEDWEDEDVEKVCSSIDRIDNDTLEVRNPETGENVRVKPREILIPDKPHGACNGKPGRPV
jgi:hypothetical protein